LSLRRAVHPIYHFPVRSKRLGPKAVFALVGAFAAIFAATSTISAPALASSGSTRYQHDGIIHKDDHGHLTLNGRVFQFTGVNIFEAATWWGVNYGCGGNLVGQLDALFARLRPNDVVRFWAFEQLGYDGQEGRIDFRGIDQVVQAAERSPNHIRLILTLGNEWPDCDGLAWRSNSGQMKDAAWFQSGYATAPEPGLPLSYRNWVSLVVNRYRSSPAVGMWEPLNEPGPGCGSNGPQILHKWFDDIGGMIHTIDPKHLVESGVSGAECTTALGDYVTSLSSAGVDVVTYHDYGDWAPVPGLLAYRLAQARSMSKPLIVGEVGYVGWCDLLRLKQPAEFMAGVSGFLPWNWDDPSQSTCGL
jgi:mannan endo-1,4-beta-mannosidase